MSLRLLSTDAFTSSLDHEPAEEIVAGAPTCGSVEFARLHGVEVGVWEITPGTVTDTEVDEVFVVISGNGQVRFADGESIDLAPGVVVRLRAGEQTEWEVSRTLRKIYVSA